jgi:uncharacterized protein (DUF58 family)
MVNERWVTLLIFIGFIGVLWRVPAMAAISAIGLTVIIASLLLKRNTLKHVDYKRRLDETRVFIGEKINLQGRATNASRLPLLSLIIRDNAPRTLVEVGPDGSVDPDVNIHMPASLNQLVSIKPRSFASRTFVLQATRRGYFPFKAYSLNAVDLLGLSESERIEEPKDAVLVYPRVFPIDALDLPPQQPLGEMVALKRFIEDPSRTMGARDYTAGDPFRMIHWKATAHRGHLQTRVSDHTSDPTTMILLNVMTYSEDWFGVEVERFEWAVSVAASMAKWAHEAGATVGLSSNGCTPGRPEALRVRPRRSPDQLVHVLESLAFISAFTLARFHDFLLTEQRNVPRGATLLIVSPIFNEHIAEAIYRLHAMGKRVAFVSVDHAAPDMSQLPCPAFHIPPNTEYTAFMRQFAAGDESANEAAA